MSVEVTTKQVPGRAGLLSVRDLVFAIAMAIACLISYWLATYSLVHFVGRDDELVGGMWAVIATIFVYRESQLDSRSAAGSRLIATVVSFALCLVYLLLFPFTALGMAGVLAAGTLVMFVLGRPEDIITTAITTAVIMVVAALTPLHAWQQPVLRLIDTVIGIAVGVSCRWVARRLYSRVEQRRW